MKISLCTGGQASVGRLLAEAEDYSHVKRNVNGYFELNCEDLIVATDKTD